jgi:hypothetical protein
MVFHRMYQMNERFDFYLLLPVDVDLFMHLVDSVNESAGYHDAFLESNINLTHQAESGITI